MTWRREQLTKELVPLNDQFLEHVRQSWFEQPQHRVTNADLIPELDEWFRSTRVNDLQGWESLCCLDVTMGCTHYIESFVARLGWDGFQILNHEYAYYSFMGKWGVEIDDLEPNKPLIMTAPHYTWAGLRTDWPDVLRECEKKNIDIHLDMAWLTLGKNVAIDFSHPCIQSVGMSISKYSMQWNRVGLRYSKQRTMDSITMFNHYYQPNTNMALSSCASHFINHVPRDYGWDTYGVYHNDICRELGLTATDLVHVVQDHQGKCMGITNMIKNVIPYSKT